MNSIFRSLVLTGLAVSASVSAHHSTAMYNYKKSATLSGTVRKFLWTNPHSYVQLLVPKEGGGEAEWTIETGTPSLNARAGWTKSSLKPGDKVTVEINPLTDGSPGGTLRKVTLPDGKILEGVAVTFGAKFAEDNAPPPGASPPAH